MQIGGKQQDKPSRAASSESAEVIKLPPNLQSQIRPTPQEKKIHICGLHETKERMSSRRSQIRANIRTHGSIVQPRDRKY
ncbi:hypothetical protein C1H46_027930 [Malus baccata]|uniref:Uncharacterized protein n=1 Tax=Malus baccata TaxID=106549 RepID=A0A540LIZ5_MALBA|nr:hypothetical protein C1H46_027930 [Malus baccata]